MATLLNITAPPRKNDACDSCHSRKIRCDKRKPHCNECINRKEPCNYGKRLKRGPKGPKRKSKQTAINTLRDQLQNGQKYNTHLQAMLFELEFNKKLVELWKNMYGQIGEGKLRPPPKFSPATEEFIRTPQATSKLMIEFNESYRFIYIIPNFAANVDFGTKIWQILTEINMADLLLIINTFETSMLIFILEYIVIFMLGTMLYQYDDIASYIARFGRYILDTIVYARDGTSDSLTRELTLQLLPALTLMSNYYRTTTDAIVAHYGAYVAVYNQLHIESTLNKELEATMICRRICGKMTPEEREKYKKRFTELYDEGAVTPSILYHYYHHSSVIGLRADEDLREGASAIQKAELYINWHLDQLPPEKRPALEGFYFTRLGLVRMEFSLRLGDFAYVQQRAGQVIFAFSRLPSRFKQLVVSYCKCFVKNHKVSMDYMALLTNPGVTPIIKQLPPSNSSPQGNQAACQETSDEAVDEWLDLLDSAENSPRSDTGIIVSSPNVDSFVDEDMFFDFVDTSNKA